MSCVPLNRPFRDLTDDQLKMTTTNRLAFLVDEVERPDQASVVDVLDTTDGEIADNLLRMPRIAGHASDGWRDDVAPLLRVMVEYMLRSGLTVDDILMAFAGGLGLVVGKAPHLVEAAFAASALAVVLKKREIANALREEEVEYRQHLRDTDFVTAWWETHKDAIVTPDQLVGLATAPAPDDLQDALERLVGQKFGDLLVCGRCGGFNLANDATGVGHDLR